MGAHKHLTVENESSRIFYSAYLNVEVIMLYLNFDYELYLAYRNSCLQYTRSSLFADRHHMPSGIVGPLQ